MNALSALKITELANQFEIENKIKTIINTQVFHNFEKVDDLFHSIFGFGLPDYQELKRLLFRRHNIVHRFALSNIDRMTVCYATYEDVTSLLNTIEKTVESIRTRL